MGEDLRERVRRRYADAALAAQGKNGQASCCEPSSCCGPTSSCCEADEASEAAAVNLTGGSYSADELGELPGSATAASLGCGNPVALATLSPGEVVLDLGSGGIDVLLSTKRDEYAALLRETGFEAVSVEVT